MDIRSILKCTRCGRCRVECPTQEVLGWESGNPRGRVILARGVTEDREVTPTYEKGIFTCTTCGTCSRVCPSGAKADDITRDVREWYAENQPVKHQEALRERITEYGNSLGETSGKWQAQSGEADAVYFAGCLQSYRQREIAECTYGVLSQLGVKALPDEQCCGSPLLRLGVEAPTVEHNVEQIRESGASTVITGCAGCYNTLKDDYDLDAEVVHSTEYIAEKLDKLDITPLDVTVTYHDPCHIARHHGVVDAPRRILREIAEYREMTRSGRDSRCCGGGGGVRIYDNDIALEIARQRLRDVPSEAEYIVTSCPMCYTNLKEAGGNVIDISELLQKAL